jgi:hypothetical protein
VTHDNEFKVEPGSLGGGSFRQSLSFAPSETTNEIAEPSASNLTAARAFRSAVLENLMDFANLVASFRNLCVSEQARIH